MDRGAPNSNGVFRSQDAKLMVTAISEPGGRVSIRICRRKSENFDLDACPLPLTHGVLDIPLDPHEMRAIAEALTHAMWERWLKQ